jgi:hypothetical protein
MSTTPNIPSTLYHYTTAEGLIGIITSGELRATHLAYLNDSSELTYGLECIQSAATLLAKDRAKDVEPKFARWIAGFSPEITASAPFVTSFCEHDDILTQWQGYGASGGGYALGLNAADLQASLSTGDRILPIVYDKNDQDCAARNWVSEWEPKVLKLINSTVLGHRTALHTAARSLLEVAASFKIHSFAHEAEWRMIRSASPSAVKVWFRNGRLVPYSDVGSSSDSRQPHALPIERIVCGPRPLDERTLTSHAIRYLLESRGYDPWYQDGSHRIKIIFSEIPFRV